MFSYKIKCHITAKIAIYDKIFFGEVVYLNNFEKRKEKRKYLQKKVF